MSDQNQTNTNPTPIIPTAKAATASTSSAEPVATAADSIAGPTARPATPTSDPVSDSATSEPTTSTPAASDSATSSPATHDSAVKDTAPEAASTARPQDDSEIIADIAGRINEAHNILIALSADPSADEMSAAIGLSLALDRAGKRATAIYSGQTPNALKFLKPESTFETSADTLQDFVIAINKEKADHLRYKLDGDFVKIFITPYKTRVAEEDLEFSYGDFNIDLVLALDVANGVDLDSALREHGRIMHDATVINITTGNPGKFGEIEWSNKSASSVSELVARLLLSMNGKITLEKDDATALLTGIIAATDQFSNTQTTPDAMRVASELLKLGANQRLISENLTTANRAIWSDQTGNDSLSVSGPALASDSAPAESSQPDATSLDIVHNDEESTPEPKVPEDLTNTATTPEEIDTVSDSEAPAVTEMTDVASPVATTTAVTAATTVATDTSGEAQEAEVAPKPLLEPEPTNEPLPPLEPITSEKPELVVPSGNFDASNPLETEARKYSQMLEDALAESTPATPATMPIAPAVPVTPIVSAEPVDPVSSATPVLPSTPLEPTPIISPAVNPAAEVAPTVPAAPEINSVPEMNFNTPGDILPPPPTPSIDSTLPPVPNDVLAELARTPVDDFGMSAPAATPSVVVSPTMPTAPATAASAPVSSPAFQIPTA